MNINIRNRFIIFGVVFFVLFALLFVQLAKLTLVKGAEFAKQAQKLEDAVITVPGARGSILDRNGLPLAYDQKSYNVQFLRDPLKNTSTDRANYTRIIMDTIDIIEAGGGKTTDTFAIKYDDKTGTFDFYWGDIPKEAMLRREENWLANMYISEKPSKPTPEEIYLLLRERYQIPAEMGYEEARKILSIWQDVQLSSWVAYKPVTIAYNVNIQTVADIETHAVELSGMSIAESTTRVYPRGSLGAHIIGYTGRITDKIITSYSVSDSVKKNQKLLKTISQSAVLGKVFREALGEDAALLDYAGTETLALPKSLTDFGFTEQETEGLDSLLGLGYSIDGSIGKDGVEKTMEAYLSGSIKKRQGVMNVQVDGMKIVRNVLSSTEPEQGNNVVMTIDVPLQQAAEESLAKNIPLIREKQLAQYEEYKDVGGRNLGTKAYKDLDFSKIKLADSGAAVVMEVDTGNILATASYPSFDLNLFASGISEEDFNKLKDDPAFPLYNKAVSSRGTPGSIFKMVTGLGALMEGATTLTEKIDDEGLFDKYTKDNPEDSPKCAAYPKRISRHQNQTIVEGLQHSCNYYFYTLADRLTIGKIEKWGEMYGLTVSTGIELPGEATGQIGGQEILFDPDKPLNKQASYLPRLVKESEPYGIVNQIKKFAKDNGLEYKDKEIEAAAEELVYLMGIDWKTEGDSNVLKDERGVAMGDHIRGILYKHLNISRTISQASGLDTAISSMLIQLRWTPINTVMTGIGQGYVQVTPVAVARYVAAIVNGGTVYEAHIIDKIIDQSGEVVYDKPPVAYNTLGAPQEYLDKIKEGMSNVVNADDGTAAPYFENFKYKNDIGGKTGTAEVSDIDLENNSWFVCFAPYDEPKIVVVAYVPHGLSGGLSGYIAQDIVEYYLDREALVAEQTIPASDSLVGG